MKKKPSLLLDFFDRLCSFTTAAPAINQSRKIPVFIGFVFTIKYSWTNGNIGIIDLYHGTEKGINIGFFHPIANAVLFLCSEKAGFITGEDICIDGGMTKQMIYHNDFGWSLK